MSVFDMYVLHPKLSAGAYGVYAGGYRASSTISAEAALEALAAKLWGPGEHSVRPSGTDGWWAIERAAVAPAPKAPPASPLESQIARAFEIADESMESLLRNHTRRCDDFGKLLRLIDDAGEEVATLTEADPAAQDAYAWLAERGLCGLIDEPGGEVILMMNEAE